MNTEVERRRDVLLSVQRALLGEISSRLRAVVVEYTVDTIIVRAVFDRAIDSLDAESMSCVEAEIIADFPSDHRVDVRCLRCDSPQEVDFPGAWVYRRRE